ncbi:rhodanese-like domain-containing protein [Aspergillus ibericus CBS 121593]|uniref:Rhodanese-like protein n=1 Tax=Aspergillus ibericus CBS 121593 TaxID=1448316 RepID=A0A395GUG4_9EURO|nr:Rhodanese-like protein [Aspergillus ibericus CBS 121593]RAK99106.1 Rhodanese-like protein [Aspergillus ibericus CBS 121593]
MASLLPLRRTPSTLLTTTKTPLFTRSITIAPRSFNSRSSSLPQSTTTSTPLRTLPRTTVPQPLHPLSIRQQSSTGDNEPSFRQWGFEDITASLPTTSPASPPSMPQKSLILIDVREPAELTSTGIIPSAVSVPLASQPDALFLTEEEFETRFGFPKPGVKGDGEIVFYCKAGVRARAAAQLAVQAGYEAERIGVYDGSWLDWAKKGGRVERWEGDDN